VLLGIGIDIIETDRFRTLRNKHEYLHTTFTQAEIECGQQKPNHDIFWAHTFASKEAILKAFSIGLYYGSFWQQVTFDAAYRVVLTGYVQTLHKPTSKIRITHSCSRRYAVGCALIHH